MGANLKQLADSCGVQNFSGMETELYVTCSCEITGWPATKAENGGTANGDTKILDAPFDFTNAATGLGYWRKYRVKVDSGKLDDVLEGEVGGQGYSNTLDFQIIGTTADKLEAADAFAAVSGVAIAIIKDKNGLHRVVGTTAVPAAFSEATVSSGATNADFSGGTFKMTAPTGKTAPIYDAATHGIDVTPNP